MANSLLINLSFSFAGPFHSPHQRSITPFLARPVRSPLRFTLLINALLSWLAPLLRRLRFSMTVISSVYLFVVQNDKAWTVQLLAVACLSIAAKIEETCVPQSIELQVGDPKYVFEAKTIQRMELLVLDTLQWKMNAITPCSFINYSLKKLSNPDSITDRFLFSTTKVVNRAMQLVVCTIKGIDYLEFKPSEIAAAVAICVSAEIQAVDIDKASSCFVHLEKGRVLKCVEMVKGMSQNSTNGVGLGNDSILHGVPQSPIGVLDVRCFSYKSDDLTSSLVGSSSSSSTKITTITTTTTATSPETKRMKLDPTLTLDS